jgi:phenylalanyl-tRNA synthetase beta chain
VLGLNISNEEILNVFRKLGFTYEANDKTAIVSVPKRRIDISIKEDLNEEVSRIYGVNNIEGILPQIPMKAGNYDKTIRGIRNKMVDLGLNETLSYVLVAENEAKQFTLDDTEIIKLLDPMSEDRNSLRHSMIPSLMKIYEYNKARDNKDVSIFEIAKTFQKVGEAYEEERHLAVLMTGEFITGINNNKKVDFYIIKGIAEEILDFLGYENRYSFIQDNEKMAGEFHPGQSAFISVNNDIVGVIGKVHPNVAKEDVFAFEINLDKLLDKKVGKMKFKEISRFPSVNKDLAVVVDKNISAQTLALQIKKSAGSYLNSVKVFDVYTGDGIEENKKSLAFSLNFGKMDATLTDEEINSSIEKVVKDLENKFEAKLRT